MEEANFFLMQIDRIPVKEKMVLVTINANHSTKKETNQSKLSVGDLVASLDQNWAWHRGNYIFANFLQMCHHEYSRDFAIYFARKKSRNFFAGYASNIGKVITIYWLTLCIMNEREGEVQVSYREA